LYSDLSGNEQKKKQSAVSVTAYCRLLTANCLLRLAELAFHDLALVTAISIGAARPAGLG